MTGLPRGMEDLLGQYRVVWTCWYQMRTNSHIPSAHGISVPLPCNTTCMRSCAPAYAHYRYAGGMGRASIAPFLSSVAAATFASPRAVVQCLQSITSSTPRIPVSQVQAADAFFAADEPAAGSAPPPWMDVLQVSTWPVLEGTIPALAQSRSEIPPRSRPRPGNFESGRRISVLCAIAPPVAVELVCV
jgi:hypothetical protein